MDHPQRNRFAAGIRQEIETDGRYSEGAGEKGLRSWLSINDIESVRARLPAAEMLRQSVQKKSDVAFFIHLGQEQDARTTTSLRASLTSQRLPTPVAKWTKRT